MGIRTHETFIDDADPGLRFLFLCRIIATKRPDLASKIVNYSRAEYIEVSETLSEELKVDSPIAIATRVTSWPETSEPMRSLMDEYRRFSFGLHDVAVRLLFSHFLAFSADKLYRPELFCWPGPWISTLRVSQDIASVFERRSAPFIDRPDDCGVYPRIMTGRDQTIVHDTFQLFYANNVVYDLARQWIVNTGPFQYDFGWLSSDGNERDRKNFGDRYFNQIYEVHPDAFELLK